MSTGSIPPTADFFRADFFRYLVLYREGGIYADSDTFCMKSFQACFSRENLDMKEVNLIVGLEVIIFLNFLWNFGFYVVYVFWNWIDTTIVD